MEFQGGNRVLDRRALQALNDALEGGALQTVFQPLWAMDGTCWGYEALTRFPNGCPPGDVWILAQESGSAVALDRAALRSAVDAGRDLPHRLFLNISAAHLSHADTLLGWGPPDRIGWEITESGLMSPAGTLGAQWLQAQGYTVAMDDAGTGYATGRRLKQLRPQVVKLDHTVVKQWQSGQPQPLQAWVQAAHETRALVLAEGVEAMTWVAALAREDIDAIQGYAVGAPAPADQWVMNTYQFRGVRKSNV